MLQEFKPSTLSLLLLGLFFAPFTSWSQKNCDCPEFLPLQQQARQSTDNQRKDAELQLQNSKNKGCLPKYYEWLAESFGYLRELDSSEYYLQKAAKYYSSNGCPDISYQNYYRIAAAVYHNKGDYPSALSISLKNLAILDQYKDNYEEADCLLMISQTFNRMKESSKGIVYARKALPFIRELTVPSEKANLLYKVGGKYLWYFQDTKDFKFLDTGEVLTREQLSIGKKINDASILRKGYNLMNGYAHERGNYILALSYLDSSLATFTPESTDGLKATNFGDKADVLMELGRYKEAQAFADSSLRIKKMSKNPESIANSYALIYQIAKRRDDYKVALESLEAYVEIQDSLTNVERTKVINELEKKYNQAKNEKTIQELAQQKRIYILLAIAGLLALVGLIFFIRQQSLNNKKKMLEAEQRLNRARINPHFFFNALASLQSMAMEGGNNQSVVSNLSKFSHIMRETLESTYKDYVTIEQETDFLNEYLELQLARFPDKFTYSIKADANLEPAETLLPAMILQPFVENSIEHGFKGIGYKGHLSIAFKQEGSHLEIFITDNGRGLADSPVEKNGHISRAMQMIRDRIYLLNIKLKTKASFTIENNSDGVGVQVKILLPALYRNDAVASE